MAIGRIALCSVKGIIKIIEYEKEVTGNGYIDLTDAVVNKLLELKAYGGCEQASTPTPSTPVDIVCNNGTLKVKDKELPVEYVRVNSITLNSGPYYNTNEKLYGSDIVSMIISQNGSSGRNVFGAYTSTTSDVNFSFYAYPTATGQAYLRYGDSLYRPVVGTRTRSITFGSGGTTGFATDVTIPEQTFETEDVAYIGHLPNSNSSKFDGTFYGNIEVSNNGTTRLKWIPCKRKSDGVIGYYEAVNGNFLEPSGSGTPVAGDEDYSNIEVYVDGTKEKVGYSGGATATCEDLLGVGDYKDEQEILSGNVITNVGVIVLDGTEDRTTIDQYNRVSIAINRMAAPTSPRVLPAICTHFENLHNSESIGDITAGQFYTASPKRIYFHISQSTTAAWKQWLADQLNAGTPVIVVYPLATPTTLSVAGQYLSIPAGDSRIEIVEGSILNLPLYAKYKSTSE